MPVEHWIWNPEWGTCTCETPDLEKWELFLQGHLQPRTSLLHHSGHSARPSSSRNVSGRTPTAPSSLCGETPDGVEFILLSKQDGNAALHVGGDGQH